MIETKTKESTISYHVARKIEIPYHTSEVSKVRTIAVSSGCTDISFFISPLATTSVVCDDALVERTAIQCRPIARMSCRMVSYGLVVNVRRFSLIYENRIIQQGNINDYHSSEI